MSTKCLSCDNRKRFLETVLHVLKEREREREREREMFFVLLVFGTIQLLVWGKEELIGGKTSVRLLMVLLHIQLRGERSGETCFCFCFLLLFVLETIYHPCITVSASWGRQSMCVVLQNTLFILLWEIKVSACA